MGFLRPTLVILLSLLIYYRSNLLVTLYSNAPTRLQRLNTLGTFDIKFQDLVRNCEDIYLNELQGFALLSCDPGRDNWNTVMGQFVDSRSHADVGIYLYRYAEPDSTPQKLIFSPAKTEPFHPLGIEYHPESQSLFVVNHAPPHSTVEIYHVDLQGATATFQRVIQNSQHLSTPNSIAAVSDKELFITNDHYFRAAANPILSKLETYAGIPGGSVAWVKYLGNEVLVETLLHLPFANGIALLNATTLAVASTSTSSVRIYHIDRASDAPRLVSLTTFTVPFVPDNLSVDSTGKLLIAGHPHAPSLEIVARNNRDCVKNAQSEETCRKFRLSYAAEWSEASGVKTLYSGGDFGSSSTAVRDVTRGVGFVSGLYHRGILMWRE